MNKILLNWHPKYKVHFLPNDSIILNSQEEELLFPQSHYPLFNQIDGIRSIDDIAVNSISPLQGSTFIYIVNQLRENSTLFQENTDSHYRKVEAFNNSLQPSRHFPHKNHSVINLLSETFLSELTPWIEALQKNIRNYDLAKIVCVRDLVDKTLLTTLMDVETPFVLMSFTQHEIKLSPVFNITKDSNCKTALPLSLSDFQNVLLHNKPVIKLLNQLFPEADNCPPITTPDFQTLSAERIEQLINFVNQQISQNSNQLTILNIDGTAKHHSVTLTPDASDTQFTAQINNPLTLQPCPILFDKDGGSRTISPTETLAKLSNLISPVTGVITNLTELKSEKDYPIKIYKTAIFRTPALKDIDTIDHNSFTLICLGKGVTHEQSKASALCEAIERYSALYQGNEPLQLSKASELNKRHYDFQDIVPYSQNQYLNFNDHTHPDAQLKQAAKAYNNESVHWLPCWSLNSEEHVYVPLSSCLANIPFDDDKFGRWHSNGCAAGNTLEEAILQGLFELIERDATAIWWYNQIPRAGFDLTRLDPEYFAPLRDTLSDQHDFWVLDLTVDIGIPVMVAIGKNKQTGGLVFGFGCHLQAEMAAQRALTELCQLIPIRDQIDAPFDFDAIVDADYLYPQTGAKNIPPSILPSGDIKKDILRIVEKLNDLGFETLVLNYSRSHLPIKTAKIFVPGLCHIWPQLANERLYTIPVALGWLNTAKTESTINQQPLYI